MMDTNIQSKQKMPKTVHWNERALKYGRSRRGYKAICSYGAPYFYNKYIDLVQKKVFYRMWNTQSFRGKQVLDVGCGVGRWCRIMRRLGAIVTGSDIAVEMINVARLSSPMEITFLNSSIAQLELPDRTFDLITSVTVLQHITDDREFERSIFNLVRMAKPGGRLHLIEVAPDLRPRLSGFNDFLTVRLQEEYEAVFKQAGAVLESSYAVDVFPLKQYLISLSPKLPKIVYFFLLHLCTVAALFIDWCFSGTQLFKQNSWHKGLIFVKVDKSQ